MFDRTGWFERSCLEQKVVWKAPADLRVSLFKALSVVQSSQRQRFTRLLVTSLWCWKPLGLSWAHSQGVAGKRWDSHHQPLNILRPSGPAASAWEDGIPCKICFEDILKRPLFIVGWGTLGAPWLTARGIKAYFLITGKSLAQHTTERNVYCHSSFLNPGWLIQLRLAV